MLESRRVELYSPHAPSECVSRLLAVVSSWAPRCGKPLIGQVSETSLRLRKDILYRNAYQSHFTATMRPEGAGTLVSGEAGISSFVRKMLMFECGIVALMFVGGLAVAGFNFLVGSDTGLGLIFVVGGPALATAFFTLIGIGRLLACNEADFITGILIRTLDAEDRSSRLPAQSAAPPHPAQ